MIDPALVSFGSPLEGCPSCHTLTTAFSYGLGAFLEDDWVMQTPLFGGYSAAVGTLPKERNGGHSVTIAVSTTQSQSSYDDWTAALPNWSTQLVDTLGAALVPDHAPPPFTSGR